jgi:hypothetical protein
MSVEYIYIFPENKKDSPPTGLPLYAPMAIFRGTLFAPHSQKELA